MGAAGSFITPRALPRFKSGNVYVADTLNNTIRKITPAAVVTTLAGTAGVRFRPTVRVQRHASNLPDARATDSAGTCT